MTVFVFMMTRPETNDNREQLSIIKPNFLLDAGRCFHSLSVYFTVKQNTLCLKNSRVVCYGKFVMESFVVESFDLVDHVTAL